MQNKRRGWMAVMLWLLPCVCVAQKGLPDGPSAAKGEIVGSVEDGSGGLLPGARVEVTTRSGTVVAFADDDGEFHVYGVAAGQFSLHVTSHGFFAANAAGELAPGEEKELATIELKPSAQADSVEVIATEHEIATAQVAAEEKQRVLGIVPNFYVVYDRNPAPLSGKQKFHLAWRSTIDPITFLGAGISAGIGQATGASNGWGYDGKGYAQRYGAAFADGAISTFLGGAILPAVFHQDPRYRYQGTGTTGSRIRHAMASVIICRGDNDKREFNYSSVLGNLGAAGLSNVYYPAVNRNGPGLTFQNFAIGEGFGAFAGLMQEFVVPKLTPHLPQFRKVISKGN